MTTYENLLNETEDNNIIIKEKKFGCSGKGLINGNRILINKKLPCTEKAVILSEELGHYHTTVGNILDMEDTANRKQELRARIWAYNKLVGLTGIIESYQHHCNCLQDMAEYLDVTGEFLQEVLHYYKDKYGICTSLDNYIIYFEPSIGVFELI